MLIIKSTPSSVRIYLIIKNMSSYGLLPVETHGKILVHNIYKLKHLLHTLTFSIHFSILL